MDKSMVDLFGWTGAVLYLVAYALVSTKKVEGNSNLFQGMNVLAGALLVINSAWYRVWPPVALNAIWAGIGLFIIGRNVLGRGGR